MTVACVLNSAVAVLQLSLGLGNDEPPGATGLTWGQALEAITSAPAEAVGLGDDRLVADVLLVLAAAACSEDAIQDEVTDAAGAAAELGTAALTGCKNRDADTPPADTTAPESPLH